MNPKYSVGELVILQSREYPEYNGEYYVHKILEKREPSTCRLTGDLHSCSGTHGPIIYLLSQPHLNKDTGREVFWWEGALRKRHEPSQMSFQSLIQSINSPVKQEN